MRASISAIVALGALLLAAEPAVAAGKLEVSLKDDKGVTINGKVTARKGEEVESCTTAAGSCTLTGLAAGVWKVSAKTAGDAKSNSKSVTVKNDHTASTTLIVQKKTQLILSAEKKETKVVRSLGGAVKMKTAKMEAAKDLGSGSKLKASGTTKDEHGVTINGKITVEKDGKVVGRSETAAGKYEVYDLPSGSYTFCFESNGGKKKTRSVVIKKTAKVTVNFQL